MSKSILEIQGIKKGFHSGSEDIQVLTGVNLKIHEGHKVAIVGQSGAGKSTLLQIAGLLDKASEGEVLLAGEKTSNLPDRKKSDLRNKYIGFVYQQHHLLRDFTALENVMMPAVIAGTNRKEAQTRATYLLEQVGLGHRLDHHPTTLSGGEQQRCAIARALMNKPKVLLADEPTGNLDPHTADEVAALLDKIIMDEGMSMLVVTHNEDLADSCDESWHMLEGKLVQA